MQVNSDESTAWALEERKKEGGWLNLSLRQRRPYPSDGQGYGKDATLRAENQKQK